MTDDEAHRGSGKWVALATALIGAVGAAISAGLIHANSTPEASNGPAPVAVLTTITPAPSTSPSPPPSPSTSAASTWRSEAIAVCEAGQKLVGEVDEEDAVNEDKLRAVAPIISQMDQLLREIDATEPQHSQMQLMANHCDQAWSALVQKLDAYVIGDDATAQERHSDYSDLNGPGNQIAENLGIARCSAVGLPSMGGS